MQEAVVEVSAPARIDLAGGTVDIWPLYLFHPEAVTINAAINLRVQVRITRRATPGVWLTNLAEHRTLELNSPGRPHRRDPYELFTLALQHFPLPGGLKIEFFSPVPKGAGLGGSSALLVALVAGLAGVAKKQVSRERFIDLVRDLETRLIRVPAGCQDYYPSVWGGVQALWWKAGLVKREPLPVPAAELEKRLLLLYTGKSRHSGVNNWQVFKSHLDGNRRVHRLFARIVSASGAMYSALLRRDFQEVGRAMAREYEARRELFPGIATPQLRKLERIMRAQGASAFKVCGAGGGGCAVVYTDPIHRSLLSERIREQGCLLLPFRISHQGLSIRPSQGGYNKKR